MFKKFSWGHGIVIALGSFIAFILFMIFLFPNGQQNSEMITENYYEEELAYQKVIDAKNNADLLPEKPKYNQDQSGIKVIFPEDINNENSKFTIDLHRADDQKLDVKREIKLDGKNTLFIPANILVKGNYVLRTMWTTNNKNFQIDYDLVW